ncbi:MAG: autotransporter-associated beta strand repeat-containing protein, partial [Verrucomicrobiaceae bacterium]|nr:autotransporter-associated beta strand repeat-containing protein [Verrucomicrobiaceae bacterium]
ANGLDSGKQENNFRPMEEYTTSGAILEVKGVISGTGSMVKVGYDTVILSGANTYSGGTTIAGGKLAIGADNALPTTGTVTTTANGVLDLNGQNQTIGTLNNVVTTTTTGSTQGFVTNGGTSIKTLTVGNGVTSDFVYSGVVQHNVALTKTGTAKLTLHNTNTYLGTTEVAGGTLALGVNGSNQDSAWLKISGAGSTFDVSAKTSYVFDGVVSGGGTSAAGTNFASAATTNAARIAGNFTVGDNVGAVSQIGSLAPGNTTTTAGDQIGHIYTSADLTLAGGVTGAPVATPTDRFALQLGGATANGSTLGWDGSVSWFSTNALDYLNGVQGNIENHDYVNVGGTLNFNEDGRGVVSFVSGSGYTPGWGDIFNLFDWVTAMNLNGFNFNNQYDGTGDSSYDLDLPTLGTQAGTQLLWDTSLFTTYGVIVVVPEPSRALLLMFGLLALFWRRRRA